ncbi:MAG: helix-turn-helix domain-containing protein [Clostridiales bacterium]|nr:helix-turn-helix domain-containing protein [Clostridiales bacterium]
MLNQYNDVMTAFDAAEALGVGKNRIYELLETGELKGFRMGRIWKIPKLSVETYILEKANLAS